MQIIQGIRDKGAAIVIGVIALSLIGFILMDAKTGTNKMFGSNSSSVGKINGTTIEKAEFDKKVKQAEDQQEQQYGRKPSASQSAMIRQQVWEQIILEKSIFSEADKLGIDFTSKELSVLLRSEDPANPLMQNRDLLDPATGKLDQNKVNQVFANIKKLSSEQRALANEQISDPARLNSVATKYYSLLNAATYYPAWMEEKDNKENNSFANISYVAIPYSTISDSAVKVTDADVEKYVDTHKDMFKQEAGRTISYVAFSQLPSADDSAKTRDAVMALKNEFASETNVKSFIARNTSLIEFDSSYHLKSKINNNGPADSIINLPAGTVYGPYVQNGSYILARNLGSKTVPDSVKARHILIATIDMQTRQPIIEDSVAKKQADSILNAIKVGADFAELAKKFSADGSKDKGGDLGTFGYDAMVPEFNEFCFSKPVGSRDVVHTMFGYHIIEILSQKGSVPVYKTAYLAKEVIASEATINNASLAATKFATEKDAKIFDSASLQKKGLKKVTVTNLIKESDGQAGQLQDARQLVRWAFEAKKGDVSDPYSIDDQFVVATVDNIYTEGVKDIAAARPIAEKAIMDQKKGEVILKTIGSSPMLESAAAAYAKQVLTAGADTSIVFSANLIKDFGQEPKVIGASFNKEYQNKVSAPILGKQGVYLLKVNSIGMKAPDSPELAVQKRKQQIDQLRSRGTGAWYDVLKKKASVTDNRSKFY